MAGSDGIALITGLGQVSVLGIGKESFAAGLAGDIEPRNSPVWDVEAFDLRDHVSIKTQCLDKASSMAVLAASHVIKDAQWQVDEASDRIGLVLGTMYGNMSVMQAYLGLENPSPLRFVHTFINAPAGLASQVLKLRGAHALLCSGAAVGLQAIRYGCYLLASGKADKVICGGVDSYGFIQARSDTMAQTIEGAAPPSEGAGLIGLEKVNGRHAPGDGYGVVAGSAVESFTTLTAEHGQRVMTKAMAHGRCEAEDIDWVMTATSAGHAEAAAEREALQQLGIGQDKWHDVAGAVGQTGGAQGGLAAVMACLLMHRESGAKRQQRALVNAMQAKQFMSILITSNGV